MGIYNIINGEHIIISYHFACLYVTIGYFEMYIVVVVVIIIIV